MTLMGNRMTRLMFGLVAVLTADAAQAQRLDELKQAGPSARLTIYPVQVQERPMRNVADVIGLVLESYGMSNLEATDAAFSPPAGAAWEDVPKHFASFLRQSPPGGFALYAQYLGEPRTGPKEVRFIVVDAAGNVVLTDRQTPADADFKRTAARDPDPMGCSVLVAERLYSQTGWKKSKPRGGQFARVWEKKSGTPDDGETKAMQRRARKLRRGLKSATMAVYATQVNNAPNGESAARLAKQFAEQLGCKAVVAEKPIKIEIPPSSNEQKRLWDLARAFQTGLRAERPATDYALIAEYAIGPKGPAAVHFVLCNRKGDWVLVDYQNDQAAEFQRLAPKNVEGCDRLAVARLKQRLD